MPARRGVVLVLVLILLGVVASAGALMVLALFSTAPPSLPSNAAVHLRLEAPFSEVEASDVVSRLFGRQSSLRSTIELIQKAKADDRVKALVIRPVSAGGLWGQVQEVRAALEDFKSSKKPRHGVSRNRWSGRVLSRLGRRPHRPDARRPARSRRAGLLRGVPARGPRQDRRLSRSAPPRRVQDRVEYIYGKDVHTRAS